MRFNLWIMAVPESSIWLNYHHLRYFWIAAKEGSLARAAAKMHVSQPSISEQIREPDAEWRIPSR